MTVNLGFYMGHVFNYQKIKRIIPHLKIEIQTNSYCRARRLIFNPNIFHFGGRFPPRSIWAAPSERQMPFYLEPSIFHQSYCHRPQLKQCLDPMMDVRVQGVVKGEEVVWPSITSPPKTTPSLDFWPFDVLPPQNDKLALADPTLICLHYITIAPLHPRKQDLWIFSVCYYGISSSEG